MTMAILWHAQLVSNISRNVYVHPSDALLLCDFACKRLVPIVALFSYKLDTSLVDERLNERSEF